MSADKLHALKGALRELMDAEASFKDRRKQHPHSSPYSRQGKTYKHRERVEQASSACIHLGDKLMPLAACEAPLYVTLRVDFLVDALGGIREPVPEAKKSRDVDLHPKVETTCACCGKSFKACQESLP